jgi:ribosomal-protein-alanine N-acetyltransferase
MKIFIETPRLMIKVPNLNEIDNWLSVYIDALQLSKSTVQERLVTSIADFDKQGFSMGSVYLKTSNEFIGRAGLFLSPDGEKKDVELGYVIHPKYRGQGYATELAGALVEWGFRNLRVSKIIALTFPDNKISQNILKKIGMTYVQKMISEGEEYLLYEVKR